MPNDIITITPPDALDKLYVLNLDTTIWSACRKLTASDFDSENQLPPSALASLGFKKICDPAHMAVFSRLKARAVSLLDRHAVRFLGGWAVPSTKVDSILDGLKAIKDEFYTEKTLFLQNYDRLIAEWISKYEVWREFLASSTVSADYVAQRLTFAWQLFRVKSSEVDSTLDESLSDLGNKLFSEIAKDAADIWTRVYEGKTEVTHKALSPLLTLRDKLKGLSFVSPHAMPVIRIMDTVMEGVPDKGKYIAGQSLLNLQGLVCLLKDKQALLKQAEAMQNTSNAQRTLNTIISSFSPNKQTVVPVTPACLNSGGLW